MFQLLLVIIYLAFISWGFRTHFWVQHGRPCTGSWELSEDHHIKITLGEDTYEGIVCRQYDEFGKKYVIGFTALSEDGEAVWGSGLAAIE